MNTMLELLLEDTCPDLPLSSCGSCGKALVSEDAKRKYRHHTAGIDTVFVRVRGIPFCRGCSSDGEVKEVLRLRKQGKTTHEADPCPPSHPSAGWSASSSTAGPNC